MEPTTSILMLWAGFLLLLWALNKGLNNIEGSLKLETKPVPSPALEVTRDFHEPEDFGEVIGHYLDTPIYCKITIADVDYHFERVQPANIMAALFANERCVKPGIVYAAVN